MKRVFLKNEYLEKIMLESPRIIGPKIGVTRATIYNLINGKTKTTLSVRKKVGVFLQSVGYKIPEENFWEIVSDKKDTIEKIKYFKRNIFITEESEKLNINRCFLYVKTKNDGICFDGYFGLFSKERKKNKGIVYRRRLFLLEKNGNKVNCTREKRESKERPEFIKEIKFIYENYDVVKKITEKEFFDIYKKK